MFTNFSVHNFNKVDKILLTLIIQLRDDCIMLIILCWICTNTGINWICDVSIFI